MAWTAAIVQKGIVDKSFMVGISYTNGTFQFVEQINATGLTLQNLNDLVATRLAVLATTETLIPQISLGTFTPTSAATPAQTPLQTYQANMRALRNAQELVNLGVIQNTDLTFVNALNAVKATFDPSFIT